MDAFLQQVREFFASSCHIAPRQQLLVAVSGGVDSVVMAHALHRLGYPMCLAHCNFGLRGHESDADEAFVRKLAQQLACDVEVTRFEINPDSDSVQTVARELRYSWFQTLLMNRGLEAVAVGTNLDDQAETMLFNLTRGTGLAGLHGIRPRLGSVVRPLLFADRSTIQNWATANHIYWREDSSNATTNYARNHIRHRVVPSLTELNPELVQTMANNAQRFSEAETLLEQLMDAKRTELITKQDNGWKLDLPLLKAEKPSVTFLYYLLKPWGVAAGQAQELLLNTEAAIGSTFHTEHYTIWVDRAAWLIRTRETMEQPSQHIDASTSSIEAPLNIVLRKAPKMEPNQSNNTAQFDVSKLTFPLLVRPWREGDRFQPFGMNGTKKVSDLLVDQKVPLPDKQHVYVLVSGDEIAWVIGYRTSERFKVDENTQNVYIAEYIPGGRQPTEL